MRHQDVDVVRGVIARAIVTQADAHGGRLGDITLRPHQREIVGRARAAIRRFGGALVADDVGSGKTFVALAVASAYRRPLVIAPAVLREMWAAASTRTHVHIPFVSVESLGRGRPPPHGHDFIIADEAHHLRNPATKRHAALAVAAGSTPVLLLSGTPVHNSARDLEAILSLFLGADARDLTNEERAAVVVRSGGSQSGPRVVVHARRRVPDSSDVVHAIRQVRAPVPVRDGDSAPALLRHALLRAWCSSAGALESMARRAYLASSAMAVALREGRHPTKTELRAWSGGDDGQLAFGTLLCQHASYGAAAMRHAEACADSLARLRDLAHTHASVDDDRANALLRIADLHRDAGVLACTQYAATVDTLWRRLRRTPGACALTARGARIASGPISRSEALALFAPRAQGARAPHDRERIRLLIATDLVSEGLNLQDAGVVVHLDLPWTAARLTQRVGRVARSGSPHTQVHVHAIAPPQAAAALLALERRIAHKRRVGEQFAGGASRNAALLGGRLPRTASAAEARARMAMLLAACVPDAREQTNDAAGALACAITAPARGWLALVDGGQDARLVCRMNRGAPSSDPRVVARAVEWLCAGRAAARAAEAASAREQVERWIGTERARLLSGAGRRHGARARTGKLASAMTSVRAAPAHRRARTAALAGGSALERSSHVPDLPTTVRALVIFVPDEDSSSV